MTLKNRFIEALGKKSVQILIMGIFLAIVQMGTLMGSHSLLSRGLILLLLIILITATTFEEASYQRYFLRALIIYFTGLILSLFLAALFKLNITHNLSENINHIAARIPKSFGFIISSLLLQFIPLCIISSFVAYMIKRAL